MHTEILTAAQRTVLDALTRIRAVRPFYLAGRTALALRHGHRRSIDFDFFCEGGFDARRLIAQLEPALPPVERLPSGRNTLYVRLLDGCARGTAPPFARSRSLLFSSDPASHQDLT